VEVPQPRRYVYLSGNHSHRGVVYATELWNTCLYLGTEKAELPTSLDLKF
jgi:hypothetical protein